MYTHTTMKTAVKMHPKPTQVRIASFPRVRILETTAVQIAATRVHTTAHTVCLERVWNP